jgi:hypothetical protein
LQSENDVEYVDDDILDQLEHVNNIAGEESDDDFRTMKESDIGSEDQNLYDDG